MEAAPDSKLGEEPASITFDDTLLGEPSTKDLEEQRRWNEERIRRRLMSEYERAGKALSEMVRRRKASHIIIQAAVVNQSIASLSLRTCRFHGRRSTTTSRLRSA